MSAAARSRRAVLPLRRWLAIGLAAVFVLPVLTTAIVVYHLLGQPDAAGDVAAALLNEGAAAWRDPVWQRATAADLAGYDADVVLTIGGQEVFRSVPDPLVNAEGEPRARTVRQVTIPGSDPVQTAYIYTPTDDWENGPPEPRYLLVPIVAVTSLFLAVAGIAWFLGRTVVRPLRAASEAARQVAAGDLDIALPRSRVREVAALTTAFEGMSGALRNSLEQQAALEQERRFFIGAIAHDLRTPLFSLRGYLEGLRRGLADTPEKAARYLAVAEEKAEVLERLIADLFDFTRLEYLEQAPSKASLDLTALLRRLIDGLGPLAETKGVRVALARPDVVCRIDGDAHLLTRAIENLLDNAIRYTPRGGSVEASCRVVPGGVEFTIADTGPGIPAGDLPKLFAPLYRGETSRNRKTGGAGLGLAIARRILLAHGGDLTARNGERGGAIFTGRLPTDGDTTPAAD